MITFVEANVYIGLCTRVWRSPTFLQWWCSQMRPASPGRGFSTAITAMFGQMQSLIVHLFTATNNVVLSTFGLALCMTFWLGLTCYPDGLVHRFTGCFWRKSYQKCWRKSHWHSGETCGSSTMGLQLTLHVRSENIPLPLKTVAGLDGVGLWLGLPGYWTSHQWPSSYWATLKPWFIHHWLILKRILLSGIFECSRQSLLCCQLYIKVGGRMFKHLL